MTVKGNQPTLQATLAMLLTPPVSSRVAARHARTSEVGHGRIEVRRITSSSVLAGRTRWPGLQQIFRIEREVTEKKSGKQRREVVYGITSLTKEEAGPRKLLRLVRGHWRIENGSHYVRDVTFDEDRSQVRSGSIPQVMAAIRNTVIGLLRGAKHDNIAAAGRHYAAHPWDALALIGISRDN